MLKHNVRLWLLRTVAVSLVGVVSSSALIQPGLAQNAIIPDATLGGEASIVSPIVPFVPFLADFERIDGGAVRGQNLFHSFTEFSINETGSALFITPSGDIANIFARITGGNPSEILGVLGTRQADLSRSNADLFLINPNGILFGENSALDVGGSFTATTASGVQFGEEGRFSAIAPTAPSSLLTINPSAYFFSQPSTDSIINQSVRQDLIDGTTFGLRVPDGEALSLLGGSVTIQGGNLTANGGIVELGAVEGVGEINLDANGRLSFPTTVERGSITVNAGANILSIADKEGSISFMGGDVSVLDSSVVAIVMNGGPGNENSRAGDLTIDATGNLVINNQSLVTNQISAGGFGNAGNLRVTASNITVNNQAELFVGNFGNGNIGDLSISAQNDIVLENGGSVFNNVRFGATGAGGDIILSARNIRIGNGSQISATTDGLGNTGKITLNAQESVLLEGGDDVFIRNNVLSNGQGDTGGIEIYTGSLRVLNGAQIQALVNGVGDAGDVIISAEHDVVLDRREDINDLSSSPSGIFTIVEQGGRGSSGDLQITARNVYVTNRAQLVSTTEGNGNSGDIIVRAEDNIYLLNSIVISEVTEETGNGNGGDIILEAKVLELINGSSLLADTENIGDAGNITIRASERVTLSGEGPGAGNPEEILPSQISTTVDGQTVRGEGGDINIATGLLSLTDRAFINAGTSGEGSAGDVRIQTNSLRMEGGAEIIARTFSSEDAGSIFITASDEIFISGRDSMGEPSEISGSSLGNATGNGGVLFIVSPRVSLLDGARISATSEGLGLAGSINFFLDRLEATDGTIATSAIQSQGGDINVNATSSNPEGIIILRGDSDFTTDSLGDGGNINLNAIVIAFDDSDILARSSNALGGNITLGPFFSDTPPIGAVSPTENNDRVDVSADGRLASGSITTPDTSFIQNSLNQLPAIATDPNTLIAGSCIARTAEGQGTFVATGSGGLPTRPGDGVISSYPTGNVQSLPSPEPQAVWQPGDPIVEPTDVFSLPDGRLVLSQACGDN